MISRIDFQDINSGFSVTASYIRCFDLDLGSTETSSDIGILSQEARTVKFKLIADNFLRGFFSDTNLYLNYKIVIYDKNGNKDFAGLIKDDGISYNKDNELIELELNDLFGFIDEAGDFANNAEESVDNNIIIVVSILSSLKKRLKSSNLTKNRIWAYSDRYFTDKGYNVLSNEVSLQNNSTRVMQRVKVKYPGGDPFYYYQSSSAPVYSIDFNTNQDLKFINELFEMQQPPDTEGILDWKWLDIENKIDASWAGVIPDDELKWYKAYYVYNFEYRVNMPDGTPVYDTKILDETLEFNTTYQPVAEVQSVYSANKSWFWFLDYKSGGLTGFSYWISTDKYAGQNCRRIVSEAGDNVYTVDANTSRFEFLANVMNRTKDFQYAMFFRFDNLTDSNGEYLELKIHYVLKCWGLGSFVSFVDGIDASWKKSIYSYRKRTLKFRGYQCFSDDWSLGYTESPPLFQVANSFDFDGSRTIVSHSGEDNYALYDHFGSVKELYGFEDFTAGAVGTNYANMAAAFPVELSQCQYHKYANRDGNNISNGYTYFDGTITHSYIDSFGETIIYLLSLGSSDTNLSYSGLGTPDAIHYLNTVDIAVFYTGKINLSSYVYNKEYNIADALKLIMVSNFFAMVSDAKNSKILVVNKTPILNSVAYAEADMIGLKKQNVLADTFDESIFDVIFTESAEKLNETMKSFINGLLNYYNIELLFTYSNLFSSIVPDIGDNFDYDGDKYSIVSVARKSNNIFELRALKNGESTLQFSDDGAILFDTELSNNGTDMLTWNIRTV